VRHLTSTVDNIVYCVSDTVTVWLVLWSVLWVCTVVCPV